MAIEDTRRRSVQTRFAGCAEEKATPLKIVVMSSRSLRVKEEAFICYTPGKLLDAPVPNREGLVRRCNALRWQNGGIAVICDNGVSCHVIYSATGMINYCEAKTFMGTAGNIIVTRNGTRAHLPSACPMTTQSEPSEGGEGDDGTEDREASSVEVDTNNE